MDSEVPYQPTLQRSVIRAFIIGQNNYCMNGRQRLEVYFLHAHDDLILRILRIFEEILSLAAAQLYVFVLIYRI